ncbi:WD40-repeat-containing domain protein [Geopyxis carbonaria]|nr:WD40-repeat-containing domain protein [Geopyxis carbonaria]
MAGLFTPTSRSAGGIPNLKLTPTNSPVFYSVRGTKSPGKRQFSATPGSTSTAFADCTLSLKRVIGCSTTAFDSHPSSRSFAYTAGAAAVVVTLDDELEVSQRFFRARPNAPTLAVAAAGVSSYTSYTPSTPQNSAQTRAAASLREAGIGHSPSPGFAGDDSSGTKTWTARERIKAATCLSFSPDGKWLAVGETGYNPRVLIFSMSKDVPSDVPVAAMSEHTFGVRDVAFSPDSKYLASIGTANDGFIYIWSLNLGKPGLVQLHASNKCTSFIRQIAWMGRCLVTVGTRHVKIWRTGDDVGDGRKPRRKWRLTRRQQKVIGAGTKVLHGRNALLGNMSESTMSCVVGISDDKALVCSERGDICLLEETEMKFSKVADAGFGVSCVAIDPERKFAWVAGKNGSHSALVLKDIAPPTPPSSPSSSRSSSPVLPFGCRRANVLAMASMLGHLFTLDSNRSLKIINMSTVDGVPVPNSMIKELPAHKDACLGVRVLPPNSHDASFFTWSADGVVLFWTLDGICKDEFQVELEQPREGDDDMPNELKAVRVSKGGDFFVTGDKYGVLRVIDAETRECQYDVKAHSGDIMDIAIHNETIVSCARDRTLQVFVQKNGSWHLSQTLDDHTASVSRVLFLEDGNKLLSCSTDRTIVIRELCRREAIDGSATFAYVPIRTLSTKASPIHMTAFSDVSNTLLVSTLDRQIVKFDMVSGKIISSFKVTDESGDAVVMDAITLTENKGTPGKPRIIVGTSTTDKSIRIYDLNGGLVDKEWGHTEGVSDVALLEDGDDIKLISTGTDGTVMVWDFVSREALQNQIKDTSFMDSPVVASKDLTATRTPLRRVLSRTELLDFASRTTPTPDPAAKTCGSQSVGSTSPPRPLRKKTSAYSLNRTLTHSQKIGLGIQRENPPPLNAAALFSDDSTSPSTPIFTPNSNGRESRKSTRERTPSPPDIQQRLPPPSRRPSYDSRSRGKSDASVNTNNNNSGPNVNGLAESLTRSLRSFRRKIETAGQTDSTVIKPDLLKDLQRELGLTVKELSGQGKSKEKEKEKVLDKERNGSSTTVNGESDMMAAMLEQYSSKLLSMVNDRLEEKLLQKDIPTTPTNIKERDRRKERTLENTGEG